jgi:hypothetical protein
MMLPKVLAITATLFSCSIAAICGADGCFDETSLIQIQKTVELGTNRQEPTVTTETTETTSDVDQGSSVLDAMTAANAQVQAANKALAEKVSDEKVAKAQLFVQKFATEVAKWNMKGAQWKHNKKKASLYGKTRQRTKADSMVADATIKAQESAAAWQAATAAEMKASKLAEAAEAASAKRRAAAFNATAAETAAYAKMKETEASMKSQATIAKANATTLDAVASANTAATSRARAEVAADQALKLAANVTAAKANDTAANANATELMKKANEMEALSRKYARAAQLSAAKAVSANKSAGGADTLEETTVITTETTQTTA